MTVTDLGKCDRHPSADAHAVWVAPDHGTLALCGHCSHSNGLALTVAGWHLLTTVEAAAVAHSNRGIPA